MIAAARRPVYGLLTAYFVSGAGTAMSAVAIPWLVLVSTGSAASTGVIGFAQMAPYVVLQAVAGPIVDRIGLRRTFVVGNGVAALVMCAIPVLHAADDLNLVVLGVLVAIAGAVRGVADCATAPLVPAAADVGGVAYERVTGLFSAANRTAMLVGMPLAGVLIPLIGPSQVVFVDAASFAAGAGILASTLPATVGRPKRAEGPARLRAYVSELAEGLRFLRADRLLLGLAMLSAVTNLFDEALTSVLLPVWAHDRVHRAAAIGLVGGAWGLGMLAGALGGAWVGARLPRRTVLITGLVLSGSPPFFSLAAGTSLPAQLVVWGLSGVAGGVLNPITGAVQYERVPAHLQARVFGVVKASAWATIPLGALFGGALTGRAGLTTALLVSGGLIALATFAPLVLPSWRDLDRPRADEPEDGSDPVPPALSQATPGGGSIDERSVGERGNRLGVRLARYRTHAVASHDERH
jgi:MFS family permease